MRDNFTPKIGDTVYGSFEDIDNKEQFIRTGTLISINKDLFKIDFGNNDIQDLPLDCLIEYVLKEE